MISGFIAFLKNWTLPISMVVGVLSYFIYVNIPDFDSTHVFVSDAIRFIQPLLIFTMLFLTFCRVKPNDLKFAKWQIWVLLLQIVGFILCALCLYYMPKGEYGVIVEGFMLCMICPTATAAAVVTSKLGGNAGTLTSYTIMINLATAILVPSFVPLIHPHPEYTFVSSFLLIISRVFPLLFCPFIFAMVLRWISPKTTDWFTGIKDLAFYIWAVSLALAIAVTMKSIANSNYSLYYELGVAAASLIACILQFAVGRYLGKVYGEPVSAAQSAGQKNTVFAIWLGYTFMNPITSIAGGFYCIWHNVYNSYQLYQKRKEF